MKVTDATIRRISRMSAADRFSLFSNNPNLNFSGLIARVRCLKKGNGDDEVLEEIEQEAVLFDAKQRYPAAVIGPTYINQTVL